MLQSAVLALYFNSFHCIAVCSMAAENIWTVLCEAQLAEYRQNFSIAPVGNLTMEMCNQAVERYVNLMQRYTHFTENVAFNIFIEGQMQLVLCISTPGSTTVQNDQVRRMDHVGHINIGDAYMWIHIGAGVDQYRFI